MVTQIYQSDCGKIFDTLQEANKYEEQLFEPIVFEFFQGSFPTVSGWYIIKIYKYGKFSTNVDYWNGSKWRNHCGTDNVYRIVAHSLIETL